MKPLLIEIGSEEIPARFVPEGLALLKKELTQLLESSSIDYGLISEYSTPRRLALLVNDVAEKQKDRTVETLGPPKKVAYDDKGAPTKAAAGFAKSLNIDVNDLEIKETGRGLYLSATVEEKGRPTVDVLSEELPNIISSLKLPKSMRWGNSSLRYFRPIQWILAILGRETIPFQMDFIKSSNISYGHRFLSPVAIKIDEPSSYLPSLKQSHVLADTVERKKVIIEGIRKIESTADCVIHEDEGLLDTVTNLVEHPSAVLGNFEDKYLELPKELLITVMKAHQKYFSMEDSKANMMPSFIVISNMNDTINDTVKRGAERVLRARLEDARFYYNEDRKNALWDNIEELKKVTFQEKLGSLYKKAERISALSSYITELLNPDLIEKTRRASMLCKADIVTGVVGEFPELQGYMGMTYAGLSGEDTEVASAIFDHYLPRFADDALPSGEIGTIVSIADKMDNIASFFYLDMVPSGSEDPYALRRQAAGIINILQSNDYPVVLNSLVNTSLKSLEPSDQNRATLTNNIMQFFVQRIEGILLAQGHSHDIISAVLSSDEINLNNVKQRINILSEFRRTHQFPALLTAAKRVYNILVNVQPGEINDSLLNENPEKILYESAKKAGDELTASGYKSLFELEKPINDFFETVLVMDKDPLIKDNRLALLSKVKYVFNSLADFSKIIE